MNLDIDVLVNKQKVASKRSWMAVDYRYPTVLVYDVDAKIFFDQIAYQPGLVQITRGNEVNGTHDIPEEFRLEFHLTLDPTAEQRISGSEGFHGINWNILKGTYSMII